MINSPNWMIVYGTDRNVGKTLLITRVIQRISKNCPIIGVKISPHHHPLDPSANILYKDSNSVIVEEHLIDTGKDSARMLKAGATRSFFIQVFDDHLGDILPILFEILPPNIPVVCESGWIREYVQPGIFIIVNQSGNTQVKKSVAKIRPLADLWVEFDGQVFDCDLSRLEYAKDGWHISP